MSDDGRFGDAEGFEELADIRRHVVKVIRDHGLRRTAETDFVRHDYAETFLAQRFDGAAKVEAAEIHSVQQDHGAAVRLSARRHVHIGHAHVLAV